MTLEGAHFARSPSVSDTLASRPEPRAIRPREKTPSSFSVARRVNIAPQNSRRIPGAITAPTEAKRKLSREGEDKELVYGKIENERKVKEEGERAGRRDSAREESSRQSSSSTPEDQFPVPIARRSSRLTEDDIER